MIASPEPLSTIQSNYTVEEYSFNTNSYLMKDIFKKVVSIARLDKHVILIGEIGVGKKRLAHMIHRFSLRHKGPFHSFYCIDINEADFKEAFWEHIHLESEHIRLKYDVLEKAGNGILYLDQFSELSGAFMLNVIQSYLRGCEQLFKYNPVISPRLIISISQEAYQRLSNSEVWMQILRLLNPISIMIPPLRERKEDIPALVKTFMDEVRASEGGYENLSISREAVNECILYHWPGNVRQLKNAIMQGSVLSHGEVIESHHLPFSMNWKLPYVV